MPRTGRPRQDIQLRPIDHLEAFCCQQVERIEHMLAVRYGADYNHHTGNPGERMDGRGRRDQQHYNKFHLMPQNDGMSRYNIMHDCDTEIRGNVSGLVGRKKGSQS